MARSASPIDRTSTSTRLGRLDRTGPGDACLTDWSQAKWLAVALASKVGYGTCADRSGGKHAWDLGLDRGLGLKRGDSPVSGHRGCLFLFFGAAGVPVGESMG